MQANRTRSSEPHPVLPAYYDAAPQRAPFVRSLFDHTARHYDRINRVFSFGTGAWYRRWSLHRAGLRPGMRLLDIAVGTGLVAREAVAIVREPRLVVGLDVSFGMLQEARRHLGIDFIQGQAETLPVATGSIDFVSMGYALRHVADLDQAFREMLRVLDDGGRVLILEIARPRSRSGHAFARLYLGSIVPLISRLATSASESETLMRYWWDTIENCVEPPVILEAMRNAGFADVSSEVSVGIFRTYTGRKAA
ncbi:class I SAM-dependent methyltransferase [Marinivivus vitaminiproducens]|uniref:class I SAM-dependent methyltransferase n=1 Tax=Marinivivus vitaminiproducens TaxID=3035935 RepID=UPI0027A009BF|nr:class I SAM-dependent methyltransferase [Geminicoccaceae bacterium SCSIO 64248]